MLGASSLRLVLLSLVLLACASKGVDQTATADATASTSSATSGGVDADTMRLSGLGFAIQKPPSWLFAPTGWQKANLENIKIKDEAFKARLREHATEPLVVITKYQDTVDTLNPVFKVNLRPVGGLRNMSVETVARMVLPQMENLFEDFELTQDIERIEISGHEAAHFQSTFTVEDVEGSLSPPG